MTQNQKIKAFAQAFETAANKAGEYVRLKESTREEHEDFVRELHQDKLPNNCIYAEIWDVAQRLTEYDDPNTGANELEPDPYYGDLQEWLHECPLAADYMNKVFSEGAVPKEYDFYTHVMGAQVLFRDDIARAIIAKFEDDPEEEKGAA